MSESGQNPFDLSNMGAMLQQLGAMLQRAEGIPDGQLDWEGAKQTARATIAQHPDPSVVSAEHERVRAAAELANLWLDGVTDFVAPTTRSTAWCKSEWLESTFAAWTRLLNPVATAMMKSVAATTQAQASEMPEELATMLKPMLALTGRMSSMMVGQQVGQALGTLAQDAWSASDIGLPLSPDGSLALVTANTEAFAAAHELSLRDVETYLAVREAALLRLFHAAPWVAPRIADTLAEYASSVKVDTERLQELVGDLDLSNPMALGDAMQRGALELPMTPGSSAATARVELLVTLIEGWVDHVTELAIAGRVGNAAAIREALHRRRVTGGSSERAFGQLLGLQLRPRKLREASAWWSTVPQERRDSLWQHPDFLPDLEDLETPFQGE